MTNYADTRTSTSLGNARSRSKSARLNIKTIDIASEVNWSYVLQHEPRNVLTTPSTSAPADRRDAAPACPLPGSLTSISRTRTSLVLTGVVNMELERVPPRSPLDRECASHRERGALRAFQTDIASVMARVFVKLGDLPRSPARRVTMEPEQSLSSGSQNALNNDSPAFAHCFRPAVASDLSAACGRTRTHFSPQRHHSLRSLTGTLCMSRGMSLHVYEILSNSNKLIK